MTLPDTDQLHTVRRRAETARLDRTVALLDAPLLRDALAPGTESDLRALLHDVRADLLARDDEEWTRLAGAQTRAESVHAELFSLLATSLVRTHGFDGGLLDAADRLTSWLQSASRVRTPVTLALAPGTESMNHVAWLLRLRFPPASVWDLPVLAHELGHHVVDTLESASELRRGDRPLAQAVAETAAVGVPAGDGSGWAHEYAADVFATYALGATYPLACVTLRIDPGRTAAESDSHPPWDRRVEVMAATLEAISAATGRPGPALTAREVVRPLLLLLPGAQPVPRATALVLADLATGLVAQLDRHTVHLRHDDATRAAALALRLGARHDDGTDTTDATDATDDDPGTPAPPVPTVLDAAWRWRRAHWDADDADLRRVEATVLRWCATAPAREEP